MFIAGTKFLPLACLRSEEDNAVLDEVSESEEEGQVIGLSSTVSRLYLDCVTSAEAGRYTCVAENRYLRIATDTKLKIDGRDTLQVTC